MLPKMKNFDLFGIVHLSECYMRLAIPFIVEDDGNVELGNIDVLENLRIQGVVLGIRVLSYEALNLRRETGYAVGGSHVELLRLCMILSNLSIVEQLLLATPQECNQ